MGDFKYHMKERTPIRNDEKSCGLLQEHNMHVEENPKEDNAEERLQHTHMNDTDHVLSYSHEEIGGQYTASFELEDEQDSLSHMQQTQ